MTHKTLATPSVRRVGRLPTIVCTDAGYDPDDLLALIIAAITMPLRLVVTCDEFGGGQRARLVRFLLNLCGRTGVVVVAGPEAPGAQARWVCDGLVPDDFPTASALSTRSVVEELHAILDPNHHGAWIGLGPMTTLARLCVAAPRLVDRLVITQTGGAMAHRDPSRTSQHLRIDPDSAVTALRAGLDLSLVPTEVACVPDMEVPFDGEIYQLLTTNRAPRWARLAAAGYQRYFTHAEESTFRADDVLTVATAAGLDFVQTAVKRVEIAADTQMRLDPNGIRLGMSTSVDYVALWQWVGTVLRHALTAGMAYEPSLVGRRRDLDAQPDRTPRIGVLSQ
ncbi:nucleoside hydrolase [Nocardia goodfellowii]